MINNKKAAMEMSVGTIVTIVLLMSVLVLGLVLITNIFKGSVDNVDAINDQVRAQLDALFEKDGRKIAIFPSTTDVTLKQGDSKKGFAFAISNKNPEQAVFKTRIFVDPMFEISRHCGSLRFAEAEDWLLQKAYSSTIPRSSVEEYPNLVQFTIPETAPLCKIPYIVEVSDKDGVYSRVTVYVKINAK